MGLQGTDLAILTARFGCARFGASRFGFIPCPEDVTGAGTVEPGEYIYRETKPPTTAWTLVNEDCVCRNLCTLALGTLTPSESPIYEDDSFDLTVSLTGVKGLVDGIARVAWGDTTHDEYRYEPLVDGTLTFSHAYNYAGSYTITVVVTDERGCDVTATLPVTAQLPSTLAVSFVMDPDPNLVSVDVATPITFTPTVTPGVPPYTYDWDFGDGTAHSTDEIPIHTYSDPATGGTYTAELTVTDADAQIATDSITFDIAGI